MNNNLRKVPIILGITGHRDIKPEDREPLKKILSEQFDAIKKIKINSEEKELQNTPFILLSPLSEGADQIAAQVAYEKHIPFIVPLPLPEEEYQKNFSTDESLQEYKRLRKKAANIFELPTAPGNTDENKSIHGENRDRQYAQVGIYIARHSQIMIALWDGVKTNKKGGTSSIVDYKLRGTPEGFYPQSNPLDYIENFKLIHITTPRLSNALIENKFSTRRYPEASQRQEEFDSVLQKIDDYNADINHFGQKMDIKIKKSKDIMIPDKYVEYLSDDEQAMLERYATADTLALYFQKKHFNEIWALLLFFVSGIIMLQVYLQFIPSAIILVAFFLLYIVAFFQFLLYKSHKFQSKYLDYRALAEGLRIQLVWNMAGTNNDVSYSYLRKQRGVLDWIRFAIRSFNIRPPEAVSEQMSPNQKVKFEVLLSCWLLNQLDFYKKKSRQFNIYYARLSKTTLVIFWFAIVTAAAGLLIKEFSLVDKALFAYFSGFSTIALAIATGLRMYTEIKGFKEHTRQYARMLQYFETSAASLKQYIAEKRQPESQTLLRILGKEALRENGDWLLLHRSRSISISKILFPTK